MRAFSIANWLVAAAFAVAAYLQLNDPDPYLWVAFYGIAAVLTVLVEFALISRRVVLAYGAICGLLAAVWLAFLALGRPLPGAIPGMQFEELKEILGFVGVGAWMVVLAQQCRMSKTE